MLCKRFFTKLLFVLAQRLKILVPREADLTLQGVSDKFRDKKRESDRKILEAQ